MSDNVSLQTSALATPASGTAIATHQIGGGSGAHAQVVTPGGNTTAAIAAGTGANTVVKNSSAVLGRVLVTAAGTVDMLFYDNATTNAGTLIGVVPANSPVGSIFQFDMPCANGITAAGSASNPGVTVSYA